MRRNLGFRVLLPLIALYYGGNVFAACPSPNSNPAIEVAQCQGGNQSSITYDNPSGTPIPDELALCPASPAVVWSATASGNCTATNTSTSTTVTCTDGTNTLTLAPSPSHNLQFSGNNLSTAASFAVTATDASLSGNNNGSCTRNYFLNYLPDGQGGWGDPHITTLDGVHYNFQGAGEFTALRGNGIEIQTRQTPVSTSYIPAADPYDGVQTCVSVYSAVAARVGSHKFSYQPILGADGAAAATGMQLRVDGAPTTLGAAGIALAGSPVSGKIVQPWGGDGIEVDYSDGTTLIVTPSYWPSQQLWYLNVNVYGTSAAQAVYGRLAERSWLPALPNGTSLGPLPESLAERYVELYGKFADAWRVTSATSLFDYDPGTTTADFTLAGWPRENPTSCELPNHVLAQPVEVAVAEKACSTIVGVNTHADCVFDVRATGNTGFAKTYLLSQQRLPGASQITVKADKAVTAVGENATFTATVQRTASSGITPAGTVQFVADGSNVGSPVTLDAAGRAQWSTASLTLGQHEIEAKFNSAPGWGALAASISGVDQHQVVAGNHLPIWLIVLLVLIVVIVLLWWFLK